MDDLSSEEVEQLSKVMGENGDTPQGATLTADPQGEAQSEPQTESNTEPSQVQGNYPAPRGSSIARAQFMQLEELAEAADLPPKEMGRMHDIKVKVEVVLGRTKMPLEDILKLQNGSVVELNKLAGEPVDIVANGKLIARAEVVVVDDHFGVKILEIIGSQTSL